MKKPLSVRLEPVTGLFSISPATNATMNSERTLNSDPQVDVARSLASLSCAVVQERIRKQAELLGWQVVRIPVSAKPICGHGVLQQTIFSVPGWCQQWALAVSCGLGGERWWAVQLSESKPSEPSKAVAKEVNATRELPVKDVLGEKIVDASRATLLAIERLAVAEVSYTVLSQQLRSMRIPHQTEKPVSNVTNGTDTRQPSTGAVYLQFAALMRDVRDKSWEAWATDSVRVSPGGIEDSGEEMNTDGKQALVRHDLRLNLAPGKMKHLQQLLSKSRDRDVAMNGHGGLAIRLRTPFGEPFVEHIRTRLRNLECLDRYVTTLQKLHYNLTAVSMAKLSFAYSDIAPVLHAQLTFASNGTGPMRLKLGPADSNPHQRIRVMLEQCLLNGTAKEAFQLSAQLLTFTLPTLQALERIERIRGTHQTVTIRVRGAAWYNLSYKAPSPACAFSIRLRPKRQGNKTVAHWHVEPTKDQTDGVAIAEELAKGLKALWQTKGKGWVGVGSGAIADTTGIGAVLEALDELVRASDAPLIAPAPEMPTGAVPKTTEQPPPLPLQAKEPQKKPAVEPAAKAAKQPAAGAKKKEEPEYIELD
ncbi:mediator complex subunit [Friedmanniomyces endolithicus]|nr:mediator complex subunit [Friedmanniomyces endolithicus]